MSFLTALLMGAGGYARGRQQRFQNEQQQQQQAESRRMDDAQLSQWQAQQNRQQHLDTQADEDRLRARGIDPTTGKPFMLPVDLTQAHPNNGGKGPQPTVDDSIRLLYGQARFYGEQGDTAAMNAALAKAQTLEAQQKATQAFQNQMTREQFIQAQQTLRDQYNQQHQDARAQQRESFEAWLRNQPTWADQNMTPYQRAELERSRGGPRVTQDQAAAAQSEWYSKWQRAITPGKGSYPGAPALPPLIQPSDQKSAEKWFSRIDGDKDPLATARQFANMTQNPTLKELLIARGRAASMRLEAEQRQQRGGGNDILPFPGE